MLLYEGRGQQELVDVKMGYDIVCCYMKEGTNVSHGCEDEILDGSYVRK